MKNLYKIQDELYIVSDKEKSFYCIKECPMAGLNIDRCDCQIFTACSNKVGNIILTTNKSLIKDGVQSIDEEFLKWVVKNPSCESVEVKSLLSNNGNVFFGYKIIIPKEESKQELSLKINDEFLDTTSKEILYTLMEEFDNLVTENSSEETLEEAAERIFDGFGDITKPVVIKRAIELVKGQQERMYSEEESIQKIIDYVDFQFNTNGELNSEIKKWFEQFKKQ